MRGEVPITVQAGDLAPQLAWTKIVASDPASGTPENLIGCTTVLLFLPLVSHNPRTLSDWNEVVGQFVDKPVNFVWVVSENEESLLPFLEEHPVRGWMLLDPQKLSYKAYGVEGADTVFVDPQGRISGFTYPHPGQSDVQAALDGRAIAIDGEPTEEQLDAIFEGKAVRFGAGPSRMPRHSNPKPDLPPSDEIHISLTKEQGTVSSTAPDHWVRRGFDLRAILSSICNTTGVRVELPPGLEKNRYDFVFVPPQPVDQEAVSRRVLEAIEKSFHVAVAPEVRSVDIYTITAQADKIPLPKSDSRTFGGSVSWSRSFSVPEQFRPPEGKPTRKAAEAAYKRAMESPEFRQAMAMAQLTGMTGISSSMEDFRRALEEGLQCPVVDETELTGNYDFQIRGEARTTQEFLAMLRDELGLVVAPARRSVEMVVVRSLDERD